MPATVVNVLHILVNLTHILAYGVMLILCPFYSRGNLGTECYKVSGEGRIEMSSIWLQIT